MGPVRPTAFAAAVVLLALAGVARAQVVGGTVSSQSTREPIRAAWVVLVDSTGAERAAALTDSLGRFTLRAPVTGRFHVIARQIGHEDRVSGLLELVAGRTDQVRLSLRERALPLAAINVEAERRCDTSRDEGTVAAILWDEARKALSAVRWTGRTAQLAYRTRHFERRLDLTGRMLSETESVRMSRGERPFTTPPPEQLAERGFVQPQGDSFVFYGPDAEVLLSDAFADTHCFRARRGTGANSGLAGLAFEPLPGRRVADVSGTMWIDTLTAALRFLEFHYTGVDYGPRTRELGGRIDFSRLPSGAWITERWRIRGPVTEVPSRDPGRREILRGFKETGAELQAIVSDTRLPGVQRAALTADDGHAASGLPGAFGESLSALRSAAAKALNDVAQSASPVSRASIATSDGIEVLERYAGSRNRGDYIRAVDLFERAAREERQLAAAWFGLGLAHAHGPELEIPGATGYQHRRIYSETNAEYHARRALLTAVELDPSLEDAAIELTALALASRDDSTLIVAGLALERALGQNARSRELLVASSDVAAARGNLAAAEQHARSAIVAGASAPAFHALGSALTRVAGRQREGEHAYLHGLQIADARAIVRYYDDARLIFRKGDDSIWITLRNTQRAEWLRRFWERSATENAVTIGERLGTHFERVAYAHDAFRRQTLRGARPMDALWVDTVATDIAFDARGIIYVRHGAPHEKISTPAPKTGAIGPNESWVYYGEGPATVYHFLKLNSNSDWQLSSGSTCAQFDPNWYDARVRVDGSLFARKLQCERAHNALANARTQAEYYRALSDLDAEHRRDLMGRADFAVSASRALTTEQALPEFAKPLDVLSALYMFRGQNGRTDVMTAILIPSDAFSETRTESGVQYGVQLSLILIDNAQRIARRDTLMLYGSHGEIPDGRYIRSVIDVSVLPADTAAFRVAVRNADQPDEGRVIAGNRAVANYAADQLMLSDLVVAEAGEGRWRRGDVQISPIPTHQVDADVAFQLFYEIYNLETNDVYETRIEIGDSPGLLGRIGNLFGNPRNRVDLRFRDVAPSAGEYGLQELRTIHAALDPGRYTLQVSVRNTRTGESSSSRSTLVVNPVPR